MITPNAIFTLIHRVLNNKYAVIIYVILASIALIIFEFQNNSVKLQIRRFMKYPLVLICYMVLAIFISNFNLYISLMMLIFLFIVVMPRYELSKNRAMYNSGLESFSSKSELDQKDNKETEDYYVDGIKKLFTGRIKDIEKHHNSELQKGIAENKRKLLKREKLRNNFTDIDEDEMSSTRRATQQSTSSTGDDTNNVNKTENKKSNISSTDKDGLDGLDKVITLRKFDPNNQMDMNLLITKEILQDMINRIDYNYETNNYLKKYIKARIEEIIDTNNLVED